MLFRNPALLFGLLLLLIPIILHLFNLQRFETVKFTNVKFLKEIKEKSQKRSKLKKWLLLVTRLLALACLVLGFAQPYFPAEKNSRKDIEIIYLDNSFSMQAKGEFGELLSHSKQTLYENLKGQQVFLITNDGVKKENFTDDAILQLEFSPNSLNDEQLKLLIDQIEAGNEVNKNIIIISDFQTLSFDWDKINPNHQYNLVKLNSTSKGNVFIDSVWINSDSPEKVELTARVSNAYSAKEDINVTLWINNEIQGKRVAKVEENKFFDIDFTINSREYFTGKLTLEDNRLGFDNDFYFSLPKKEKLNVLSLGKTTDYLKRIYLQEEFNYTEISLAEWGATDTEKFELVILNELESIPNYLAETLIEYIKNGGKAVLIPGKTIDRSEYNKFLSHMNLGSFADTIGRELKITDINYDDPFFKDVFKQREENFSYPTASLSYRSSLRNFIPLMKFENDAPFLAKVNIDKGNIYLFTSPLDDQMTNLTSSTLIVPLFYNFATKGQSQKGLFYRIGRPNEISIEAKTKNDEVYHLTSDDLDYIPLQIRQNDKVILTTNEIPNLSGTYEVKYQNLTLGEFAYNYPKSESSFRQTDISEITKNRQNITVHSNLEEALKLMKTKVNDKNLWQLFITFVLIFLIAEMLIQKFIKN